MNSQTLLLRQVNPGWIRNDKVTSQAFNPTPKDAGYLSTYNGDLIAPRSACLHFIRNLRLQSAGVVAVNVDECAQLSLPVIPDPRLFSAHTVIDFTALSRGQCKSKAKELAVKANKRGWLFKFPNS